MQKETPSQRQTEKIERQNEKKQRREAFKIKSNEMKRLLKEAHATYYDGLKLNKKKNKDDLQQIKSEFKTSIGKIHTDFENKTIPVDEKKYLVSEATKKFNEALESHISMVKNRRLAVSSEYKRTLTKIEKTYMEEVVKHKFSFLFKRLVFGINKEFTRITWWSRKHTFYDFVIIIIIIGIMALIFFGVDTAYLKA